MKFSSVTTLVCLGARSALTAPAATPNNGTTLNFQIEWAPCPNLTSVDCGQIQVPLDWNDTSGEQITVGMVRLNATNQTNRIGSLFFNPGGPGQEVTSLCSSQALGAPLFLPALTEHFDIVCPDPRGIGTSTPVRCDPQVWNSNISIVPSDVDELSQLVALNKARGESCLNLTGPLLGHIDTVSVANDFEAIRIALNDGQFNYVGLSYGTFLGTTYAEMYPDNVRAMVLDGAVDFYQSPTDLIYSESSAGQSVLTIFFDWCAANTTSCGGFEGDNLAQMFDDLVAQARKSPIPAPGCAVNATTESAGTCMETVGPQDILYNAQNYLLFKYPLFGGRVPGWEALGFALNQSISENNATLLSSAIATSETDPLYPDIAIPCLDVPRVSSSNLTSAWAGFNTWQIMGDAFNAQVGSSSQLYVIEANCVGWPINQTYQPHFLNQTAMNMAPPMLIVNANHDPSTSYAWASSLTAQIPTGVLLTRNGDGHTSFFLDGEATATMNTYLVNLTLPAPGTIVNS